MKKLLLTLLLSVFSTLGLVAATDYLQLSIKSGGSLLVELTEEPVIIFSGDNMIVRTSISEMTYPKSDVLMYNFLTYSSVKDITTDNENIFISNISNGVRITGQIENSHISVYDINGLMTESINSDSNTVNIVFSNKPKGMYIILINNISYKYLWR